MLQRPLILKITAALAVLLNSGTAVGETILLVVPDAASLGAQDTAKKALIESWGFNVMLISANATQAAFDGAVAAANAAYVSEEITSTDLGAKLKSAVIGVALEEAALFDEFGFSSTSINLSSNQMDVTSNSHHLTSSFSLGARTICSSSQDLHTLGGTIAAGAQVLAEQVASSERMLMVLEKGAVLYGGGTAAGRRVKMPWGGNNFDINALNTDGRTLMRRALNWLANDSTLVAHWKLDDGSGTLAADSATNNNGTLTNSPAWVSGRVAGALNFDGANDYVIVTNSANLQMTTGITIAAWIKADSWGSGSAVDVIARKGEGNPTNWQLAMRDGHVVLLLDGYDELAGDDGYPGNTLLSTSTWYHVAATWDGSSVKVYVNAELDAPSAARSGTIGTDTRPVYLGGRAGSGTGADADYFDGILDDVRIYNRALSHAEVIALYDMFPLFTDVTSAMGFNVQTTTSADLYGSGFHWADYDRDGDLDAIITGNSARLMTNTNAGASFAASSIGGGNVSLQGAMVDLDNDDDVDFWSASVAGFEGWLRNNGSASFASAGDAGLSGASNIEGAATADINGDGWCDIVLFGEFGNWVGVHQRGATVALTESNNAIYGLNDAGDYGNGDYCSTADINNDGRLDFFYHYGSGKLFLSEGDGTYLENASGISVTTGTSDKFGSAWGDYDNDGDVDLFATRYDAGSSGYLWRNDGSIFTNVASTKGITDTTGQRSCSWGDYDNDGDLDLYICTTSGAGVLYRNYGAGALFMSTSTGAGVIGNKQDAVFVDYDNDGDLDLAVTRGATTNVLLRNNSNNTNYLKVRVIGAGANATNKAAIGTRVDLYDSSGTTLLARREIGVARGFAGSEPLWVHFGGVNPNTTYRVKAHFLSGTQVVSVVPSAVSTTIASRIIAQMVTIQESAPDPMQVIQWREVDPAP